VSIDLAEHLRRIASDLYQAYRDSFADVRMDIETDRVELGIEQAIPCGLIAGEILSNAFKYAFPRGLREGGTIVVRLRSGADGDVEMHIGDDGVGMPEEIARDQRDRVGLSLIGLLAEQLNAELATGREGGTSYTLRFRVRPVA
jgi:two-component sensor histidine kinase